MGIGVKLKFGVMQRHCIAIASKTAEQIGMHIFEQNSLFQRLNVNQREDSMGTRCDFYVGLEKLEWLGSYGWDGYPDGFPEEIGIFESHDEESYRQKINQVGETYRGEFTLPSMGWPWPWNDSGDTDYAYTFAKGQVLISYFGCYWKTIEHFTQFEEDGGDSWFKMPATEYGKPKFPDMSLMKNATYGDRSGLAVISQKES
jgi:hypothetical protein